MINGSEEISKALNSYFLSVFTEEINKEIPEVELIFRGKEDEKLVMATHKNEPR